MSDVGVHASREKERQWRGGSRSWGGAVEVGWRVDELNRIEGGRGGGGVM